MLRESMTPRNSSSVFVNYSERPSIVSDIIYFNLPTRVVISVTDFLIDHLIHI